MNDDQDTNRGDRGNRGNRGNRGEHLPEYVQPILRTYDEEKGGLWRVQMFRRTCLLLPDGMDRASWTLLGYTLRDIGDATPWWLGDWLNKGEEWFGEEYSQALDPYDRIYAPGTLANYKSIAQTFPPERRREDLSFSIHQAVASVYRADQKSGEEMLSDAEANKLSREEVRAMVNDWWAARHDEEDRRHGARDRGRAELEEVEVHVSGGAMFTEVYVLRLEAIAREFAKMTPWQWDMCRWCGIAVPADDVEITPAIHDSECIWREAVEMFPPGT